MNMASDGLWKKVNIFQGNSQRLANDRIPYYQRNVYCMLKPQHSTSWLWVVPSTYRSNRNKSCIPQTNWRVNWRTVLYTVRDNYTSLLCCKMETAIWLTLNWTGKYHYRDQENAAIYFGEIQSL